MAGSWAYFPGISSNPCRGWGMFSFRICQSSKSPHKPHKPHKPRFPDFPHFPHFPHFPNFQILVFLLAGMAGIFPRQSVYSIFSIDYNIIYK